MKKGLRSFFTLFRLLPVKIHLLQRTISKAFLTPGELLLNISEPPLKFSVGLAKGVLGIESEKSSHIDQAEEKIANLLLPALLILLIHGLFPLLRLLFELFPGKFPVVPVEPDIGRLLLHPLRFDQSGKMGGNPIQQRFSALFQFDDFPVISDLSIIAHLFLPDSMGVAPDQFL